MRDTTLVERSNSTDILNDIYRTQSVSDGRDTVSLSAHISREDGEFIQRVIASIGARRSLEVGMAYGISTLFICEAITRTASDARHVAIDPFQRSEWRGIGLTNVARSGFDSIVEFVEDRSELVLPKLLAEQRQFDFALIDGLHTFDQALMEFYYINRMLPVGGVVLFDDADWPSIRALTRYAASYAAYQVIPRHEPRPTLLGRLRRLVVNLPWIRDVIHPSIRKTSWEMGLGSRCVALKKIEEDSRADTWFPDV